MNDFFAMYIFHGFTNLFHKASTGSFSQYKVLINHSFEKFTTLDSTKIVNRLNETFDIQKMYIIRTVPGNKRSYLHNQKHHKSE